MDFQELKKMPKEELDKKLYDLRTELMKLNAQVAIGTTPKNTKQIRDIKRTIARVETLNNQTLKTEISKLKSGNKSSTNTNSKKYKRL